MPRRRRRRRGQMRPGVTAAPPLQGPVGEMQPPALDEAAEPAGFQGPSRRRVRRQIRRMNSGQRIGRGQHRRLRRLSREQPGRRRLANALSNYNPQRFNQAPQPHQAPQGPPPGAMQEAAQGGFGNIGDMIGAGAPIQDLVGRFPGGQSMGIGNAFGHYQPGPFRPLQQQPMPRPFQNSFQQIGQGLGAGAGGFSASVPKQQPWGAAVGGFNKYGA